MNKIKHLNASAEPEEIIQAIREDGCVVLDNLLTEQQHSQLKIDTDYHLSRIEDCQGDFYGYSTKRLGLLFNKSKVYQDMALNPLVLSVMDEFLLPSCSQYQINLTQAISIGSDEPQQIMHQDDPMFPFMHDGYEAMINCMWAVDDFTAENGATVLVPGSHKWPREDSLNLELNDLSPELLVAGEMKKGSVLIYLGSLFHCGGHNKTDARRCGAVISYSLGWLKQAENSFIGYTPEELFDMPEQLQRLVGYFVHKPNLGSVNGVDPLQFVRGLKNSMFTEFLPEEVQPYVREYRESAIERNNKKAA